MVHNSSKKDLTNPVTSLEPTSVNYNQPINAPDRPNNRNVKRFLKLPKPSRFQGVMRIVIGFISFDFGIWAMAVSSLKGVHIFLLLVGLFHILTGLLRLLPEFQRTLRYRIFRARDFIVLLVFLCPILSFLRILPFM